MFVFVALPLFAGAATSVSSGEGLAAGEFRLLPVIETQGLLLAAIVLLVSHLISFRVNFIKRGEFRNVSPMAQTMQPYARVFVLHLVIVFGGVVVFIVGQPMALLVLLVVLKTVIDVVLHVRAHRKAQTPPPVVASRIAPSVTRTPTCASSALPACNPPSATLQRKSPDDAVRRNGGRAWG